MKTDFLSLLRKECFYASSQECFYFVWKADASPWKISMKGSITKQDLEKRKFVFLFQILFLTWQKEFQQGELAYHSDLQVTFGAGVLQSFSFLVEIQNDSVRGNQAESLFFRDGGIV